MKFKRNEWPMKPIPRPVYEKQLIKYLNVPEIKILKGVRRCGKSTLLLMLKERLLSQGVAEHQVFYKSFDEYDVPLGADATWLKTQLDEALQRTESESPFYVLLDEVQTLPRWEDVIRRLYKRDNTQVFITGSNAHLLSSDLATYLSGRYIEIDIMPLQFREYKDFCDACGWSFPDEPVMLDSFLNYGGMPGLFQFEQDDVIGKEKMLSGIFDTVVMNDIALHARISDFELLSKLIRYVFSTSGNLFSTKRIVDTLSSYGRKTSSETVETYLDALEDAMVLNQCEQFGLAGKNVLRPLRKFYPIDTGLRGLTDGFQSPRNTDFKLENAVYNQLRFRGFNVKVGTLRKGEVDFVATKGNDRSYYQVALSVVDEKVLNRETASLEQINDSYPKTIITLDGILSGVTDSGIRIESFLDWSNMPNGG